MWQKRQDSTNLEGRLVGLQLPVCHALLPGGLCTHHRDRHWWWRAMLLPFRLLLHLSHHRTRATVLGD